MTNNDDNKYYFSGGTYIGPDGERINHVLEEHRENRAAKLKSDAEYIQTGLEKCPHRDLEQPNFVFATEPPQREALINSALAQEGKAFNESKFAERLMQEARVARDTPKVPSK